MKKSEEQQQVLFFYYLLCWTAIRTPGQYTGGSEVTQWTGINTYSLRGNYIWILDQLGWKISQG